MAKALTFHIVYGKISEVDPVIDFIRFAANYLTHLENVLPETR